MFRPFSSRERQWQRSAKRRSGEDRTLEIIMWKLVWLLPALLFGASMLSQII
jgi:hypothetical protein